MKKLIVSLFVLFGLGFVVPEKNQMPVVGATVRDWNQKSFWYYPWGHNRVHKGIDIFAKTGTNIVAPTSGFVLYSGLDVLGGNVVLILGAKWRLHYFAHLKSTQTNKLGFIDAGEVIGKVGTTGNAKGKSPHLHYSIKTLYPQFWLYNLKTKMAWQRLFYVKPDTFLAI